MILEKLQPTSVHLTGGEPLLHRSIGSILTTILQRGVSCLSIITSGNIPVKSMGGIIDKLNMIKQNHADVSLSISKDVYHPKNSALCEFKDSLDMWWGDVGEHNTTERKEALDFGRSHDNNIGSVKAVDSIYPMDHEYFQDSTIMINVFGDIYHGCEWSYAAEKRFKGKVCIGNIITDSMETITENYLKLAGKNGVKITYCETSVELEYYE